MPAVICQALWPGSSHGGATGSTEAEALAIAAVAWAVFSAAEATTDVMSLRSDRDSGDREAL